MSEKRFKNMGEVDDYLEKQIQNEKRFALEYDSNCYKCISDNEQKKLYSSRESICDLLNQLNDKNEQLKNYFKKRAECSNFQINKLKEEIAELQEDNVDTIVELSKENEKLKKQSKRYEDGLWVRFTRLEKENEQLKAKVKRLQDIGTRTEEEKEHYADLYNECRKKLECCEYEHFLNELDEIHEKVDKGDLSDFNPLKEDKPLNDYNPLKEKVYYWQCKYYRRDYEHKMDMCTRCNYGGLLNYCLKDKCDKMVKRDCEVTITEFENGMSISWKKGVDKR